MVAGRLFSEGLHVLGRAPGETQMAQYLSAFFGDDLPEQVRIGCSIIFLVTAVAFSFCMQVAES